MNSKGKTSIGKAVILASALIAPFLGVRAADSVSENRTANGKVEKAMTRTDKMLMSSAILAESMTTNYLGVMKIMTPEALRGFAEFGGRMKLDGKQLFLPDFCKVKYSMLGGFDENGFVLGLYNPFFDAYMVFLVEDRTKVSISGFRAITRTRLIAKKNAKPYPAATAANPPEDYFLGVMAQVKSASDAFKNRFMGADFRKKFGEIAAADAADDARLVEILKFRIATMAKVTKDKNVFKDAVLSSSIITDPKMKTSVFVASDHSTKRTLESLEGNLAGIRDSFKFVAYFPTGEYTNLIYWSPRLPTLLIQAHVGKDSKTWLRMFDAHLAVSQDKSTR